MEPGSRIADVRCGAKQFVCASAVLRAAGGLLRDALMAAELEAGVDLAAEAAEGVAEPVLVELPAGHEQNLGTVLRFFESGDLSGVPTQGSSAREALAKTARELRATPFLAALERHDAAAAEAVAPAPANRAAFPRGPSSAGSVSLSTSAPATDPAAANSKSPAPRDRLVGPAARVPTDAPHVAPAQAHSNVHNATGQGAPTPCAPSQPAVARSGATKVKSSAVAEPTPPLTDSRGKAESRCSSPAQAPVSMPICAAEEATGESRSLSSSDSVPQEDAEGTAAIDMDRVGSSGAASAAPLAQGNQQDSGAETVAARLAALETQIAGLQALLVTIASEGRVYEQRHVELQQLMFERDQLRLRQTHRAAGRELAYNLLVVGVTGTGKSSSLNTLVNRQMCLVSGAQGQGTRGCNMQDGIINDELYLSFVDTQGLGADTSITDSELLAQIMTATESINRMRIISNILISMDTASRATPSTMANQLTLIELFGELRESCFLVLTKWNSAGVQASWLPQLRTWTRRWRRARSMDEITEEPPSYEEMYSSYCNYIMAAMNNNEDAGAFSKMGTLLSWFSSRVIFAFNLDQVQAEDLESGELEPHIEYLYHFYRKKALTCLQLGSTRLLVENMSFLRDDRDTMAEVASRLVASRDDKIRQLEQVGLDVERRNQLGSVFAAMSEENTERIRSSEYSLDDGAHLESFAALAGFETDAQDIGCRLM